MDFARGYEAAKAVVTSLTGGEIVRETRRKDGDVTLSAADGSKWRVTRKRNRRTERFEFGYWQVEAAPDDTEDEEND